MKVLAVALGFGLILALLSFNWSGFSHYQRVSENYALVSNTGASDLHLSYLLPNGDAIGRIPGKVVAVGWDARYVVAQRQVGSGSQVEFFYLDRKVDGPYAETSRVVFGPFSRAEYLTLEKKLSLPTFNKS